MYQIDEDSVRAIVHFEHPGAHLFGPPNDETMRGHPSASRGLRSYSVSEVERSSWIRSLERMNAVHPQHSPKLFADLRHYVFAFHDSTFECIAEGLRFEVHRGSMTSAVQLMTGTFGD